MHWIWQVENYYSNFNKSQIRWIYFVATLYKFKAEFGFLFLFSCIVYFVYFTNYFRVCIFVYLLTINFIRVLIVYFQNIVYSCITINFTVSYVKIAHIYYIPCTCNYSIYFGYFIWICMWNKQHSTCAVYSTFLNPSTDTVSYAICDQSV